MTVIAYFLIFALFLGVVAVGGAICESEAIERVVEALHRRRKAG